MLELDFFRLEDKAWLDMQLSLHVDPQKSARLEQRLLRKSYRIQPMAGQLAAYQNINASTSQMSRVLRHCMAALQLVRVVGHLDARSCIACTMLSKTPARLGVKESI